MERIDGRTLLVYDQFSFYEEDRGEIFTRSFFSFFLRFELTSATRAVANQRGHHQPMPRGGTEITQSHPLIRPVRGCTLVSSHSVGCTQLAGKRGRGSPHQTLVPLLGASSYFLFFSWGAAWPFVGAIVRLRRAPLSLK